MAEDTAIWNHAKHNGFMVVSLDSDFYDLSILRGHPPKLIWLRFGNSTVQKIETMRRPHFKQIEVFAAEATAACLEIFFSIPATGQAVAASRAGENKLGFQ